MVTIPDTDTEQLGTSGQKEAYSSQASEGNALKKYHIPKHLGKGKSSKVAEIHQQVASNPALGGAMGRSILRLSRKNKKQNWNF